MGRKSRSPSATRSSKIGSCPQGAASCLEMPREITHHLAVFFTARAPARPPLELDGEDWHLHMQETLGDPNTRRSHWRCCSEFICKFQLPRTRLAGDQPSLLVVKRSGQRGFIVKSWKRKSQGSRGFADLCYPLVTTDRMKFVVFHPSGSIHGGKLNKALPRLCRSRFL